MGENKSENVDIISIVLALLLFSFLTVSGVAMLYFYWPKIYPDIMPFVEYFWTH